MNHTTTMMNTADGSRLSQLSQLLQSLPDCEDFPQSHSPFMSNLVDRNGVDYKYNHRVMCLVQWSRFGCHENFGM